MKQLLAMSLVLAMSGVASANVMNPNWDDSRAQEKKDQHDKKDQQKKDEDKKDEKDDQDKKDQKCEKEWWQCQGKQDDKQGDKQDDQDKKDDQDGKKQQDDDGKEDPQYGKADFMRVDCRYHNVEKIKGINHCYASAIYVPGEYSYRHVQLGVGCDFQTIYNDKGRVQIEQVGERISPPTAAFPGLEIFPHDALRNTGTYESVLDIRAGRLSGTCYVHTLKDQDSHRDSSWNWQFGPLK